MPCLTRVRMDSWAQSLHPTEPTWHVAGVLLVLLGSGWLVAHQCSWSQEAGRFLNEGRRAADGTGDARALVERAGLKGLPIVIVLTVQITAHCHHVWKWWQSCHFRNNKDIISVLISIISEIILKIPKCDWHAQTPSWKRGRSAEKSQYMPLWGSHTSRSLQDWPIWRAHDLQHPQPSSTELTPGAQWGRLRGHLQGHWQNCSRSVVGERPSLGLSCPVFWAKLKH